MGPVKSKKGGPFGQPSRRSINRVLPGSFATESYAAFSASESQLNLPAQPSQQKPMLRRG